MNGPRRIALAAILALAFPLTFAAKAPVTAQTPPGITVITTQLLDYETGYVSITTAYGFRGSPSALVVDLTAPTKPLVWLAFFFSLVRAVGLSFAFRFLYNATAFWLMHYRGAMVMSSLVASLLSGLFDGLGPLSGFNGFAPGDVDRLIGASIQGQHVGVGDVPHVNIIADLVLVAVDGGRLAGG